MDKCLYKVEFDINNTICRSTGKTPSMLLFGINQRDLCVDLRSELEASHEDNFDLEVLRAEAQRKNLQVQTYNKQYYDKTRKTPRVYEQEDFVMVKNVDTTPGVNKKLLPKYRGPYAIKRVLDKDRYLITDIDGI
ncbi:hypothetical protein QE152_g1213 [Popillia japonica]|uniref:Uncharacterized protein n=1 Tax=Popillia japonica TaxID=7064 RepID=A0AAW1N7T6_POPJA